MAEIRCPNCGKNNPDNLDICQFCQTPLKPESVLRIGQRPTKKNTGELESVLPDWLRDVRQQARDSALAEAQAAAQSKPQTDEPPDLLAGLASQASSADDEEVPDWLASLNPEAKPKAASASSPEPDTDFFAQSHPSEAEPEPPAEPPQAESPSWMDDLRGEAPPPAEKDELSDWFTKAAEEPQKTIELDSDVLPGESDWASNTGAFSTSTVPEQPAPKEEEDLSWLHNLEAAAKQAGDLQTPQLTNDWNTNLEMPSTPAQSSAPEDLSWLDSLGGIDEPSAGIHPGSSTTQNNLNWLDQVGQSAESPQSAQPGAPQEDLSWLNNLGAVSEPSAFQAEADQPAPSGPISPEEDLSWLGKLGGTSEPSQPAPAFTAGADMEPPSDSSSSEDLSWLKDLGAASETAQPSAAPQDLNWPNNLGSETGTPARPFTESPSSAAFPRQTAPLGRSAEPEAEPDWLRSAIEPPSMPAPGDLSLDWFSGAQGPAQEKPVPATPPPTPFESDLFSTPSEPSPSSNRDVDSLFSIEMPDWLSTPQPEASESGSPPTPLPAMTGDESLAPVDLPSWVQAMRPVEAVISETRPSVADQPTETEGPLAGLQGVIPIAPIGSSRRPQAVSLKLQASQEQQVGASLLEQILGSETSPRTLATSTMVAPQQWLRWLLTGLLLIVLSGVIFLRSPALPASTSLPVEAGSLTNAVMNIPVNAKVLVVVDYEPSLAGEMEVISRPLLDQMVLLSHPRFSFVSTSPNGFALVERLVSDLNINQAGSQTLNLGYLPGGATGVLGFMVSPKAVNPLADVQLFSEYSAFIVLSDHAESGRVWVEQLQNQKQTDAALVNRPLLVVASAQAGPLLEPYVLSGQISGMLSGISDAARYEAVNNGQAGLLGAYWSTFGVGLMMAVALIIVGSLWSLFTGLRTGRADTE